MRPRGLCLCGFAAVLAAAAAGAARSAPVPPQDEGPALEIIRKEYRWADINNTRFHGGPEGSTIVDTSRGYRQFTTEILIPVVSLKAAIASFGIPSAWMRIVHKGPEDLRVKMAELRARAAPRGIIYKEPVQAFGVDYAWMAKTSREDVRTTATGLFEAARGAGYDDERKVLGLLASFVQSLAYASRTATRIADDGTEIYVGGVAMPLEALATGAGDCDTKCVLLGSLLSHVKGARMILLRGGTHVFAAVRGVPRPRDRFVRVKNDRYVLVELTSRWPIGQVPSENWRSLEARKLEIVPLIGFAEDR
ncbi:MAG: hypothetical protein H6P95_1663 [Candidatus Aminicenantes bacterium]|jgi:hypothetical protein|nr:hypothetical protein [Candidatus Aminicenantes bacterium]